MAVVGVAAVLLPATGGRCGSPASASRLPAGPGADRLIGRRLAELYRDAGLVDVTIEARAGVYPLGHSRRTIRPDLVRTLRPQILASGAADEQELDELDAAARKHLADPEVVVMPYLNFLATGRKPARA